MTDKPTPPEGYEVMQGKGMSTPVPEGSLIWLNSLDWSASASVGVKADPSIWYAVPMQQPVDEKPTPPEGYEVKNWMSLPPTVPNDCKYWDAREQQWSASACQGESKSLITSSLWYAVPLVEESTAQKDPIGLDPKKAQGEKKPQLQLIPPALNAELAKALQNGAAKYGAWNWRENKVELMTYIGAMRRHLDDFVEGENSAPDSGVHHLGHIAANCAILLDAAKHGTLVDNRPQSKQSV